MSRYGPGTWYMQGIVLTSESRVREVAGGFSSFRTSDFLSHSGPASHAGCQQCWDSLAQVPFAAQRLACSGVCMSSLSWALSHQRAVVGAQAGRPAPKPLAWHLEVSLTLDAVSSGTGPGRMWFLRPALQVDED